MFFANLSAYKKKKIANTSDRKNYSYLELLKRENVNFYISNCIDLRNNEIGFAKNYCSELNNAQNYNNKKRLYQFKSVCKEKTLSDI